MVLCYRDCWRCVLGVVLVVEFASQAVRLSTTKGRPASGGFYERPGNAILSAVSRRFRRAGATKAAEDCGTPKRRRAGLRPPFRVHGPRRRREAKGSSVVKNPRAFQEGDSW
jgi:hypothetical protein